MEILIGREEQSGKLGLMVEGKCLRIDGPYEVPITVSRCRPNEHMAHCSLIIGTSGKMKIVNLNPQNCTYVNGEEVDVIQIDENSIVELGVEQYRISIKKILKSIGYERPYSIKHLKRVWERYDRALLHMQLEQQKSQNQQRLQGILSQLSMLCVIIPSVIPSIPIPVFIRVLLIIAALGIGIYFYVKGTKSDDSFVMKKRELDEEFKENYVCPKCGRFFGFQSYDLISLQKSCTNSDCKCKYIS